MKTRFTNFIFIALGVVIMSLASCEKEVDCPPIPEYEVDTLSNVQLASTELVELEYDPTANTVTFTMSAVVENNFRIVKDANITEDIETKEVEFDIIYDLSSSGLNAHLIEVGEQLIVKNYLQTTFDENGVAYSKFNGSEFQVVHTFKKKEVEEIEAFGKKFSDFIIISPSFYLKDFVLKETGYAFNFDFTFNHEGKSTQAVTTEAGGDYDPVETISIDMIDSTLISAVYANDAISLNMQAVIQKVITIATLSGADTISKESETVDFVISYPLSVVKSQTFAVFGEADLAQANYSQTEFANGVATSSWGSNNKITHTLGEPSAHKVEAFGKTFENFVEPMVPTVAMTGVVVDETGYVISFDYNFGNEVIATADITGEITEIIETISVDLVDRSMTWYHSYSNDTIKLPMQAIFEQTTTISQAGVEDIVTKERTTVYFQIAFAISHDGINDFVVYNADEISRENFTKTDFVDGVAYSIFGENKMTHTISEPVPYKVEAFGKTFENFINHDLSIELKETSSDEKFFKFVLTFRYDGMFLFDLNCQNLFTVPQVASVEIVDTTFVSEDILPGGQINDSVYQYRRTYNLKLKVKQTLSDGTINYQDVDYPALFEATIQDVFVKDDTHISTFEPENISISFDKANLLATVDYGNGYNTKISQQISPDKIIAFGEELVVYPPRIAEVTPNELKKSSAIGRWYSSFNADLDLSVVTLSLSAAINGAVE